MSENDLSARASATVAEALGLPVEAVYVAVGTEKPYRNSATTDDLGRHSLSITISDPKVSSKFSEMEKDVLAKLAKLEAFRDVVQFESDAANVVHRKDQLETFRLAGAQIPENFKEWIGFNPDNVDRWEAIPSHALQNIVRSDEHGVTFNLRIPEGENAGKEGGAIKADLEARKGEIMGLLQKRAEKYLTSGLAPELAEAKKAEIAQQFAGLSMEISYIEPAGGDNFSAPGTISVSIASKAQKESGITFKDKVMTDADKQALRDSNPLTASNPNKAASQEVYAIDARRLGKALGRAVLFGGEHGRTPTAIFPKVAGKEDMKTAIAKQLVRFKATHPAMAKDVDDFLNDEAFKGSDWQKPKRLQQTHKVAPDVFKDATDPAKANEMTVTFSLKAEDAAKAFAALAAGGKAAAAEGEKPEELAQSLLAASKALSSVAAKLAPKGGYAQAEEQRSANGKGFVLGA